ncbi:MAG: hypothetical protein KDC15_01575, partial [Chitinophagaceae bacterium]|nr:hypothetical protein [Chitinophagaceae bacterium]
MSEEQFFKDRPETNIFILVLQKYLPFWPLFLIFTIISLSISWLYLRSQTRIYQASAKVLLKDPQKGGGDTKVLDALNIFSEKKIVENEIIVLRSSSIMQEVVRRLNIYNTVYNEGNVRVEELYKENSPVSFIALNKDSINGGGKYYFSVNWDKKSININNQDVPFNAVFNIAGTLYKVVPNEQYNKFVTGKNFYVVFNTVPGAAGSIIGALSASATSYSSTVIDVKIQTPVPAKGADILNALFDAYNADAIEDKNQIATKTMQFIDDRLLLVTGQLDSVEKNVQDFKTRESVYDLGTQASMYLSSVNELDKRNSETGLQLDILNDIEKYVNAKGRKPGTVPAQQLLTDPTLASLLNKLYEAEFNLDKVSAVNGEKSDAVILATDEVARIKKDIRENLNNIRNDLKTEVSNVNARISKNNGLLNSIPKKERALLDISRQQAIKNNIYTFLLQKKEETALSSAGTTPDLRVLEKGGGGGLIRPIAKNYYMVGFMIGLLAAAFYLLLKEHFNRKILFRSEVENKTGVPVIAELIQAKQVDNIAISEGKRTVIAEQFRSLRTNLAYMGLNEQDKVLLVTSSISGEGKSFISLNLALSITLTGKRVALMELDLRKPKISKYLNVKRDPGISSYLINKAGVDEISKETKYPNLFVISAGPIPPNPTELIGSPKF